MFSMSTIGSPHSQSLLQPRLFEIPFMLFDDRDRTYQELRRGTELQFEQLVHIALSY